MGLGSGFSERKILKKCLDQNLTKGKIVLELLKYAKSAIRKFRPIRGLHSKSHTLGQILIRAFFQYFSLRKPTSEAHLSKNNFEDFKESSIKVKFEKIIFKRCSDQKLRCPNFHFWNTYISLIKALIFTCSKRVWEPNLYFADIFIKTFKTQKPLAGDPWDLLWVTQMVPMDIPKGPWGISVIKFFRLSQYQISALC